MLIEFKIENWASFRKPTTLSMAASTHRTLPKNHIKMGGNKSELLPLKLLPIAVLFGETAAGKSNLINALKFLKNLVCFGPCPSFKDEGRPRASLMHPDKQISFMISFVANNDTIYEYSVSIQADGVILEEVLSTIHPKNIQDTLYHRVLHDITLDPAYKRLKSVYKYTPDTKLFLTSVAEKKMKAFLPAYNWFKNNLIVVTNDQDFDIFSPLSDYNDREVHAMVEYLNLSREHLSDGAKRAAKLLPIIAELSVNKKSNKTVVIDNFDQLLHTTMTQYLIEFYVNGISFSSKNQLILSLHDVMMMNRDDILGYDQMYIVYKDPIDWSILISLCQFNGISKDKNVVHSYLSGRFCNVLNSW